MPEAPAVNLRLFGAPQLRRGGQVLHVGARKALALLALAAVEGVAPRERLALMLWPDVSAEAALRNLRVEVFRLGKFGAAPQPVGDRSLELPPAVTVDLLRFRAALAAGNDAAALAVSAASLLDGLDGIAGAEFDGWLQRTRTQVLLERQRSRSRLADRLEAEGDFAAALVLHQQALAEDSCAEAAACAAMRLHVALGERAAAAELLTRLRRALRDELELALAPQTLALAAELRLAAAGAAIEPRPARPAEAAESANPAEPLLPERVPFVGRRAQAESIHAAWAAGRRVYLSGVAGSGKSRLAAECAAARGAWLRVACEPSDPALPYASALRVLRALRESAGDAELPPWVRRELAWLLPEFGEGPAPVAGAEAGERLRAAFAAAWQMLAAASFDTIVLDDWHWADDASVELWQRVEDRAAAAVVAYRSAQLGSVALARMRGEVDRGAAVAIELDGLSADETLTLVQTLSHSAGGELFSRRLHGATAGNPFHLIETLRHLAEQRQLQRLPDGRWSTPIDETTADYAELPVPASVREVVLGRVRALGETTRRLLEAASLLGERIDLHLLEGVIAIDADEHVHRLEHAQAARLIRADGDGYRFAHDLIRHCLAAGLSPARRRLLHARLARRLEACAAEPALVAAQFEAAGEPASAIGWRVRAAEQAWRGHAPAQARAHYERALADGAGGRDAVALLLALAEIERTLGNAAAAAAALDRAVAAARGTDGETMIGARLAQLRHWANAERNTQVLAALDALAADLPSASAPQRATALQLRALVFRFEGRHDEARALDDEAIALLDGVPGALAQRAELLDAAARSALGAGQLARGEALAERAVVAAESAGNDIVLSRACVARGVAALYGRNDRATAAAAFERARVLAQRVGHVPQQRAAIINLVKLHGDAGRTGEAIALLDEGEALAPGFEHLRAELAFKEARYYLHYFRGEVAAARAAAEQLTAAAPQIEDRQIRQSTYQLVLDLYLHSGDLDTAERLLGEAGSAGGSVQHAVLVAKRAWLQLARGAPRGALDTLAAVASEARVEDRVVVAWVGAAAALALGDLDRAREWLAPIDIADDHVVDALAMLLVQRLRIARATGTADPAARARARELLPRTPALEAALLGQALG
jgi:DNA-binding SARP family transcriptional activator